MATVEFSKTGFLLLYTAVVPGGIVLIKIPYMVNSVYKVLIKTFGSLENNKCRVTCNTLRWIPIKRNIGAVLF